jgi:hypothetical protein
MTFKFWLIRTAFKRVLNSLIRFWKYVKANWINISLLISDIFASNNNKKIAIMEKKEALKKIVNILLTKFKLYCLEEEANGTAISQFIEIINDGQNTFDFTYNGNELQIEKQKGIDALNNSVILKTTELVDNPSVPGNKIYSPIEELEIAITILPLGEPVMRFVKSDAKKMQVMNQEKQTSDVPIASSNLIRDFNQQYVNKLIEIFNQRRHR